MVCPFAVSSEEVHMVEVTTLPDTAPPEPSGSFRAVDETSFLFSVQQDEPGTALVAIVLPREQDAWGSTLAPGAVSYSNDIPSLLRAQQVSGSFCSVNISVSGCYIFPSHGLDLVDQHCLGTAGIVKNLQVAAGDPETVGMQDTPPQETVSTSSASQLRGLQDSVSSAQYRRSFANNPVQHKLSRAPMGISWSQADMSSIRNRQLSSDSLHVRSSGAVLRQSWEASSTEVGTGSLSARTADSTTVAAQQCQLPPAPRCNSSTDLQVWEEALEGMDLERVLLLSCEALTQVGETAIVRYPPSEPSTASEIHSIGGIRMDEVCAISSPTVFQQGTVCDISCEREHHHSRK